MSVILFAENIAESASTVTVTSALTANPLARLSDRDRSLQCIASAAGQWDIDLDMGAAGSADAAALALVNHNITASVEVYADAVTIGTTLRATLAPSGLDPFYGTFTAPGVMRYWRIRVLAFASAPAIGEVLLGTPHTLSLNPSLASGQPHTLRNMVRDLSQGGYTWSVQKGAKRARLAYVWEAMSAADLAILEAASVACDDGVKPLLVRDPNSVLRWMVWETINIEPSGLGGGQFRVEAAFVEAL